LDFEEVLNVIRRATIEGVIDWQIDSYEGVILMVPNIGRLFLFKAELYGFDVFIYPYWKSLGHNGGSLLVFALEVAARDDGNMISSDPVADCEIEPRDFDLLFLYLVILWDYTCRSNLSQFRRMYDAETQKGNSTDFIPKGWNIHDILDCCA